VTATIDPRCVWTDLTTGEALCDAQAAYALTYDVCSFCYSEGITACGHSRSSHARLCPEHSAQARIQDADLIARVSLVGAA
jgi:hypothetical protein